MAGRFVVETVFKMVDKVVAPVTRMQNRVGKFTRSMTRGLNKANRALGKVVKGLKRGAGVALKFVGGGIAAGFVTFALALNKVANSADNLAKITSRLKFPIEEFQEWRFVAEQSGLTTDQFDKSIEKFTKAVGEARSGTGTLITILKKANPQLLQQITAADNVADAFDIYLEALRGTENQLDKTAIATAGFGRTGGKFLNITKQSAKEIAKLRKEMRDNGVVTKEQAAAAEAYNDATNSLKLALVGLLNNVLLPMFPAITKTVKEWRAWIVVNKEFLTQRIVDFLISIKNSALEIFETLKKLNKENSLLQRMGDLVMSLAVGFEFLVKHGKTILLVVAGVVALSAALNLVAVVMGVINLLMKANPIGIIISLLVGLAALIILNWTPIKEFFTDLWQGITDGFSAMIAFVTNKLPFLKSISSIVSGFFGSGDNTNSESSSGQQNNNNVTSNMVTPQARIARTIEETRTTSAAEVTIMDQTGCAKLTGGKLGAGLNLQASGAT